MSLQYTRRGRKNPQWQAFYDSKWNLYVRTHDGQSRKITRQGRDNALLAAKALTYNPANVWVMVYPSVRSKAKKDGVKRFMWTRTQGWRTER